MPIYLPDWAVQNDAQPYLRDFGSVLTPFLGGPEQRINRLGTRFGLQVTLPPAPSGNEALTIQSRLLQGRADRLVMEWPQPGFDVGDPGAPLMAAAVAAGTALPIKGMTPGHLLREGQFLSIIHLGRRYVHMIAANATVAGDGTATLSIFPMIRTSLAINDVVEIARPMIEGLVSPGDELSWRISVSKLSSFTFTVAEAA